MELTFKNRYIQKIGWVFLFILATSGCKKSSAIDMQQPVLDEETGEYVVTNPRDNTVWRRCNAYQTWNTEKNRCEASDTTLSCEDIGQACPEGFRVPSQTQFGLLLCSDETTEIDLYGGGSETCPGVEYGGCADCDACRELFGDDKASYPGSSCYRSDDKGRAGYVGVMLSLETGCAVSDWYSCEMYSDVKCIKASTTDGGE